MEMISEKVAKKRKAANGSDAHKPKKAKNALAGVRKAQNAPKYAENSTVSTDGQALGGLGGSKSEKTSTQKDAPAAKPSNKRSADAMASNNDDDKSQDIETSATAVAKKSKKQKKTPKAPKDAGILADATKIIANASAQLIGAVTGKIGDSKKAEQENADGEKILGAIEIEKSSKSKEAESILSASTVPVPKEELVAVKKMSKKQRKQQSKALAQDRDVKEIDKSDGAKGPTARLQTLDELIANGGLPPYIADVKSPKPKGKKSKANEGKTVDSVSTTIPMNSGGKHTSKDAAQNTPDAQNLAELAQATGAGGDEFAGLSSSEQGSDIKEDDQTAAFLAGFESDTEEPPSGDDGYNPSKPIPSLDKKVDEQIQKLSLSKDTNKKAPGIIYIGRLPHGFYENELRKFFTQFGRITRLRVSRNRSTGASKHYAYLEFASAEVASIAAQTMNSYLLFGHILKCQVIPPEQVHERLFIGANKKFRKVPWNAIEGRKLERGKTREGWDSKIGKEKKKRSRKNKALQKMGYEYEGPELKTTAAIPIREEPAAPHASTDIAIESGEAAATTDVPPKATKQGKTHKTAEQTPTTGSTAPAITALAGSKDITTLQVEQGEKKKKKRKRSGKEKGKSETSAGPDGPGGSDA